MRKLCMLIILVLVVLGLGSSRENGERKFAQRRVCVGEIPQNMYSFFEIASDTGIVIPGLGERFVPQGIAWLKEENCFLLSGYFRPANGNHGSVLFSLDGKSGNLRTTYTVEDEFGELCFGHFSGVTIGEKNVFVADGERVLSIPLEQFENNGVAHKLRASFSFRPCVNASACTYADGLVWVCEYRKDGASTMVGYRMLADGKAIPHCILQAPEKVQGVSFSDGCWAFSLSHGRRNASELVVYADPRKNSATELVIVEGVDVPLWRLTEIVASWTAPPMAEGCCNKDGHLYLVFESGAYYYRAFDADNQSLHPTDTIWRISPGTKKPLTGR